jgi:hypothetical protein
MRWTSILCAKIPSTIINFLYQRKVPTPSNQLILRRYYYYFSCCCCYCCCFSYFLLLIIVLYFLCSGSVLLILCVGISGLSLGDVISWTVCILKERAVYINWKYNNILQCILYWISPFWSLFCRRVPADWVSSNTHSTGKNSCSMQIYFEVYSCCLNINCKYSVASLRTRHQ